MSKQMHINRLPLCDDVLTIIKNYCFYDRKTALIIKAIKEGKQQIVEDFKHSYFARNRECTENSELWSFCFRDESYLIYQMNCLVCGNFKLTYIDMPNQMRCNCPVSL